MNIGINLNLLLGMLTLTSWMLAGAVAVFGIGGEIRHDRRERLSRAVALALDALAVLSGIAMLTSLMFS